MSKVQSPKPQNLDSEAAEARGRAEATIQAESADVGDWTLDIGLTVSDLRKSFYSPSGERVEVLRGVSFSAHAGEAIAITGASGVGKSTLLHLLGGLESADHGSIVAGQFAIEHAGSSGLAHWRSHGVGFVFQFHHLLPDLTAAENVSLPLRINRTNSREALCRAEEMLQGMGFDKRASASVVGHLSGGEQQRVALCRALITRPALILADEPTGNLDAGIGAEIARSLVNYAHDNGAIVILATHNHSLAEMCDRSLVLKAGRLSFSE